MAEEPQEIQTFLEEKWTRPQVGDTFDFDGRTYECTNVDWDRKDDEITATWRNKDKPDPVYDPNTYYRTESLPLDHPSQRSVRPVRDDPQA